MSDYSGISDGLTRIGFPIVFMQDTGGKCIDCQNLKWFNLFYLLTDVVFSFLMSLLVVLALSGVRNRVGVKDSLN